MVAGAVTARSSRAWTWSVTAVPTSGLNPAPEEKAKQENR